MVGESPRLVTAFLPGPRCAGITGISSAPIVPGRSARKGQAPRLARRFFAISRCPTNAGATFSTNALSSAF